LFTTKLTLFFSAVLSRGLLTFDIVSFDADILVANLIVCNGTADWFFLAYCKFLFIETYSMLDYVTSFANRPSCGAVFCMLIGIFTCYFSFVEAKLTFVSIFFPVCAKFNV